MIYYLILAHKSPEQLESLAKSLYGENSKIYIHIDGYTDIMPFKKNTYLQEYCTFIEDVVKIRWGGFSMVQATLNGFKQIKKEGLRNEDFIIVLSGQDFPLHSQHYIKNYLDKYLYKSFIEYRIQPNEDWNILNRVMKYHFHDVVFPNRLNVIVENIVGIFYNIKSLNLRNQVTCYALQRVVNIFMPLKTFFVNKYTLYRGSQRQILSGKHIHYILSYLETSQGKKVQKEFKYTAGPDELFFQTLLLNSNFKDDVVNQLQWYIDWQKGPQLPRVLDESDYNDIINSNKLFARKTELGASDHLIEKVLSSFSL